jgi:glycosyltransferase involved in cell wall biosynthesis
MVNLKQIHLVLFFTYGMSLDGWEKSRLFDREVALYKALLPHLGGITFITYGDKKDLQFAEKLNGIEVICNHRKLSMNWYRRYLAYWPAKWQQGHVVFKSNQIQGSDMALDLAKRHGKPFISRCGYLLADSLKWRKGPEAEATKKAMELEQKIFSQAHRVVVTTQAMQNIITNDYECDTSKIRTVANYVDTDLFTPSYSTKPTKRLIIIGRLERQKNIDSLIIALADTGIELWIVGQGSWEERLLALAKKYKVEVKFHGVQSHRSLPELLNSATAFILPSHWEGHPKTLLEALSCGLPAIGGDIASIRGVIKDGENGLLCGLTPEAIKKTVLQLLADQDLQKKLGKNARQYALENLTIGKTVERELEIIRELIP